MGISKYICRLCNPACCKDAAGMSRDEIETCTRGIRLTANFVKVV